MKQKILIIAMKKAKHMKQHIILIFGLVTLSFISCNDWFDVTSGSEIREEDHYSSTTGFQQSLIGCYIGMADETLYGRNLTWNLLELLGNQYEPLPLTSVTSMEYRLQQYNYQHSEVVNTIESIWAKAYSVIANANKALVYIDKNRNILHEIDYQIIKGELLAIRAYMHFDLLRLYGYGNWEERAAELNAKLTIPYVVDISKKPTPQQSGEVTIGKILSDLEEAASLLKDYDPITGQHSESFYAEVNADGFMNNRNIRLNYLAVKGLQARVLLWEGSAESKKKALAAAEEVIDAVEEGVRLESMETYIYSLPASDISRTNSSLATEHLFGLNVPNMSTKMASYINPSYLDTDYAAFYLRPEDAVALYENSTSDVRYAVLLSQNTNSSSMGFVPLKYYQANQTFFYSNKVSMIRIPEIYYIAAECYATGSNPNLDMALDRLNSVRNMRGLYENLEDLTVEQTLEEIKKEYHKEFLSEGVMFYFYKRTGATVVPHYPEVMGDEEYLLPYPAFELQAGRVQ
jgi:hypothetical protein